MTTTTTPVSTPAIAEGRPFVTHYIARSDLELALGLVKRANSRARRVGLEGYEVSFAEAEPQPVYDEVYDPNTGGFESRGLVPLYYVEMVDLTIIGSIPRIGDYEVIALLEDDEHAGIISRVFPGVPETDLSGVRVDSMECDHCHITRSRVRTYVLRDLATGALTKVGKGCLSLYTGLTVSPSFASSSLKLSDEMDELVNNSRYASSDLCVETEYLLTLAVGAIQLHGWRSKAKAYEEGGVSTAQLVSDCLSNSLAAATRRERFTAAADPARVAAVLRYVREDLREDGSEYVANLRACTAPDLVGYRNFGLVTSAVASYDRHVAQLAERARAERATGASEWVARPKDRITVDVEIVSTSPISGYDDRPSTVVKMVTSDGDALTWFATGVIDWDPGSQMRVRATVKGHTVFRGTKETRVTRVATV